MRRQRQVAIAPSGLNKRVIKSQLKGGPRYRGDYVFSEVSKLVYKLFYGPKKHELITKSFKGFSRRWSTSRLNGILKMIFGHLKLFVELSLTGETTQTKVGANKLATISA